MLRKQFVREMRKIKGEWCVSLYLPISPNDIQKNRNRLRKLMFKAEKKLLELGTPIKTVAEILLPVEAILDNNLFWKDKKGGLAIFLSPTSFNWHQLKLKYKEMAIVSNRFYLKPLVNSRNSEAKMKIKNLIQANIYPKRAIRQAQTALSFQ